jgi:hypothetical protein
MMSGGTMESLLGDRAQVAVERALLEFHRGFLVSLFGGSPIK